MGSEQLGTLTHFQKLYYFSTGFPKHFLIITCSSEMSIGLDFDWIRPIANLDWIRFVNLFNYLEPD